MKTKNILLTIICFLWIVNTYAAESEPNDSKSQANTLALNGNNSGGISPGSDVDWWKITTNKDGQLNVTLTSTSGQYCWEYLYDHDGTTLLVSNNTNGTVTISKDGLAPGTYYVQVVAYFGGETPSYTISNTLSVAPLTNDVEPDDVYTQANVLAPTGSTTGHIGYYYNLVRDAA